MLDDSQINRAVRVVDAEIEMRKSVFKYDRRRRESKVLEMELVKDCLLELLQLKTEIQPGLPFV